MTIKNRSPLLISLAILAFPAMTYAAKFSDLIVVKEAAKAGKWTMSTSGTLPDGKPLASSTNTVCATKQEVIESLNNPFMWNEKTGEEDSDCPTTLTTNTATIGIASLSCKMKIISLPGQPPINLPDTLITTEFKKNQPQYLDSKNGQHYYQYHLSRCGNRSLCSDTIK